MFIKEKLKYFTRPKQISPDLSGVSGDFRIVIIYMCVRSNGKVAFKVSKLSQFPFMNDFTQRCLRFSNLLG